MLYVCWVVNREKWPNCVPFLPDQYFLHYRAQLLTLLHYISPPFPFTFRFLSFYYISVYLHSPIRLEIRLDFRRHEIYEMDCVLCPVWDNFSFFLRVESQSVFPSIKRRKSIIIIIMRPYISICEYWIRRYTLLLIILPLYSFLWSGTLICM